MRITKIKRLEFNIKFYRGGTVKPETELDPMSGEPVICRGGYACGVIIKSFWHELPNAGDGEYVLTERLSTNMFGCYDEGRSEFELITRNAAEKIAEQNHSQGIINQFALLTISDGRVSCDYSKFNLCR